MDKKQLDEILLKTLDDLRISRGEKKALNQLFDQWKLSSHEKDLIRGRIFDLARDKIKGEENRKVLGWLEDMVKILHALNQSDSRTVESNAYFSPGDDCIMQVENLFFQTRRTADVCVFTITSNRIARAMLEAFKRGVKIRIITDDDKSFDLGSDIVQLSEAGIPVAIDQSESHMHHKFALFDKRLLLSGSFNWTRSGAEKNQENVIVSDDQSLVDSFQREFDRLWKQFK